VVIMVDKEPLIPKHGGYRKLKSFQIAQLIYDMTVRFCELYVDRFSRTRDKMVQAARSGVQNIAEGSQASATSKKTELKLTNIARASLEELRLDYEDFLRQRGLPLLAPDHPSLLRLKRRRCAAPEALCRRGWRRKGDATTVKDKHGLTGITGMAGCLCLSVKVHVRPCLLPPWWPMLLFRY
jgi:four helix bundle protein